MIDVRERKRSLLEHVFPIPQFATKWPVHSRTHAEKLLIKTCELMQILNQSKKIKTNRPTKTIELKKIHNILYNIYTYIIDTIKGSLVEEFPMRGLRKNSKGTVKEKNRKGTNEQRKEQ